MAGPGAPPWDRRDAAVSVALFLVAAIPCLLVGRAMLVPEEALDPILDALEVLRGGGLFANHNPRFGYGRALSYVPLVASADSLLGFAVARALVTATVAPTIYAASRLLGADRLGAGVAGLLLVVSRDLLQNLGSGYEAYLAPEWSALAVLGVALLAGLGADAGWNRPRRWAGAGLLGVAVAFAALNHLLAVATVVLIVAAGVIGGRRATPAASAALGLAALLVLPQVGVVADAEFAALARPTGAAALGPGQWKLLFGSSPGVDTALLAIGPALALAFADRRGRVLGVAGLVMLAAIVAAGSRASDVNPWYWRSALPLGAACLALAARDRARWPVAGAVVLAAVVAGARFSDPDAEPEWSVLRVLVVHEAGVFASAGAGPWGLAGYGHPTGRRRPELLPLALDAVLAGRSDRFPTDVAAMEGLPTIVQFEGAAAEALAARPLPHGVTLIGSGRRGATFLAPDAAAARALGATFCELAGGPVRYDDLRDALGLLREGQTVTEGRPPGVHACAATQD